MSTVVEVVLPERYVRLDDGRLGRITTMFAKGGRETTCMPECVSGVAQACDQDGRPLDDEWHAFEVLAAERLQ